MVRLYNLQACLWAQLTPYRDQELRFEVRDSPDYENLKLSIFNDDKKTDLIGETWLDLGDVVTPGGGRNDAWHSLKYRDKYAGEVRIEMSYYDSRPRAEGSVFDPAEARTKSSALKRRPLPNAMTASPTASSPGSATAFGPRDMDRRSRGLSITAASSQNGTIGSDDPFRQSVNGLARTSTPYGPDDYHTNGYEHEYGIDLEQDNSPYNTMQSDFLPHIPPKTSRVSLPQQNHRLSGTTSPLPAPPRELNLAHHQSMPNVRGPTMSQVQRYTTANESALYRHTSHDEYEQSFHGTILEDADPADALGALPTRRRQSQATLGQAGGSRRTLPSPTGSPQYPSATGREEPYRQSRGLPDDSPSPRHRNSQIFNTASPTQPSPLRRELPACPSDHAHPLRHARSSTFSSPGRSDHHSPTALHPPMNRHSVSDPYANTSPTRSHPLAQEVLRRSQSPQSYHHDPYDRDGPQYNTANTPLYRPQAVSPHHSPHVTPGVLQYPASNNGPPYSPSARAPPAQRPTPARRSVPNPKSPGGSAMPFSPDSFDVHNPSVRSSPLEASTNPQKPFQVPSSPLLSQSQGPAGRSRTSLGSSRDPSEPIRGVDGREIDPSDHLPVDSWAPEPEVKIPCKEYGTSDKGFGPRAAAPTTDRPKRTSILVNVRNKLTGSGSSPTLPNVESPTGFGNASPSSARALRKSGPPSPARARRQSDIMAEISPNPPAHNRHRYSDASRHDSPVEYASAGSGSAGYDSAPTSAYKDYGYGSSALERELSQIDIGSSTRKGVVRHSGSSGMLNRQAPEPGFASGYAGGYAGGYQQGSVRGYGSGQAQGQMAMYEPQPQPQQMANGDGRRSYDGHGARYSYR